MPYSALEEKLKNLPENALKEISMYVDYIFFKYSKTKTDQSIDTCKKGFGCLKDIPCKMSSKFDDPIDDFEEYM